MNLIAFTGLAGCGKTTAALALVTHRNYARISFADTLRAMLRALGVTPEQMSTGKHDPIEWLGGKTPRQIMQTLGTEWGREMIDPDIWVNATRQQIRIALLDTSGLIEGVVIDDCRFDNEAEMIHELGGRVIAIERAGVTRMAHASERGVSPHLVDNVIGNDGENVSRLLISVLSSPWQHVC